MAFVFYLEHSYTPCSSGVMRDEKERKKERKKKNKRDIFTDNFCDLEKH